MREIAVASITLIRAKPRGAGHGVVTMCVGAGMGAAGLCEVA